jgi:hypothetical protein
MSFRALNDDLYRYCRWAQMRSDFGDVVIKVVGHYAMLEPPAEFDHLVAEDRRGAAGTGPSCDKINPAFCLSRRCATLCAPS